MAPIRQALRAIRMSFSNAGSVDRQPLSRRSMAVTRADASTQLSNVGVAAIAVPGGPEYTLAWQDWLNLRSMTAVARLIARSALDRTESRGSHFHRDFPESDPRWLVNVLAQAKGQA